jgi:inner membrane protein
MASPLTHAVVAATLAASIISSPERPGTWLVAIACAIAPDLDALGGSGFASCISHSAAISRARLWSVYFMATLSHGMLDTTTDGGWGVAFFSPLDQTRYFFPFRVLHVAHRRGRPERTQRARKRMPLGLDPCGLGMAILWSWNLKRTRISSLG